MKALNSFRRGLPAMALLAACWGGGAQAQSSVQIYGALNMDFGRFQDSGGKRNTQLASGKLQTSYIGFRGTEDLGGGLSALFVLEPHIRLNTGEIGRNNTDPFFSRNSVVGLKSETAGTLLLGRYNQPFWLAVVGTNPFGSSTGYGPGPRTLFGSTGKIAGDGAWNNSIVYVTPKLGNFEGSIQHSMKEAGRGGNTSGSITYRDEKLVVMAAVQQVKVPFAISGKETAAFVGASYNFGVLRAFAQAARVKETQTGTATANTTDNSYQLGASVPLSPVSTFLASFAEVKTSGNLDLDLDRKFFTVGYDYRLSRRTQVYGMFMTDKNTNASRGNSYSVGVRHTF